MRARAAGSLTAAAPWSNVRSAGWI